MAARVILPYCDVLVRIFEDGAAVVVHIQVIGRREDSDHRRELFRWGFAVHCIARSE